MFKLLAVNIIIIGGMIALSIFFDIPTGVFIFILMPLMLIFFTAGCFLYNSRQGLQARSVPETGSWAIKKSIMLAQSEPLFNAGFELVDSFIINSMPTVMINIYADRKRAISYLHYHLGQKISGEFETKFISDIEFNTANSISSGLIPRPDNRMIQIIENAPQAIMFNFHLEAVNYLESQGIKRVQQNYDATREEILSGLKREGRYVRNISFWPIKLIIWTLTKRGKIHLGPLRTQVENSLIKLPNL
jgi:hypothetical protein